MLFGRGKVVARSQELIFLDADDDLGTIRSKLEASTAEENYLVIPSRSPVLRTPLEFRMMARIANEVSSETILVTGDPMRRRMANQEGFRTRGSLRTLRHLMVGPGQRGPLLVFPDWLPGLGSLVSALLPIGLLALAAVVILPQLRVTLVPQQSRIARELDITVDPQAREPDVARGVLPGELLTQQFQIPGSLAIPADRSLGQERARGSVTITSTRPQAFALARGSRVAVPDGPRFTLDNDLNVVPRVPLTVGITAADPGTSANVPAGRITQFDGLPNDNVTITNPRPTAGGTDRPAKVVAERDLVTLKEQLMKRAQDQGFAELRSRAGTERTMPEMAFRVVENEFTTDQQPGAEADQLTGRLVVTATATAYQNRAFNDLAGQMLIAGAGPTARLDGEPALEVPFIDSVEAARIKVKVRGAANAVQPLDTRDLEQRLRGKSLAEAREIVGELTGRLAQPARIDMTPSWAPRAFRITVEVLRPGS